MSFQTKLRVNEIFGPTIQGEGPWTGRNCHFIRLAGCNLDCRWCDTPYTWDWTGKNGVSFDRKAETHIMTFEDIMGHIEQEATRLIITGGEPMIQATNLDVFVQFMDAMYVDCQIETNGTLKPFPGYTRCRYVVSPKLRNAQTTKTPSTEHLAEYAELDAHFKYVVTDIERDIDEIQHQIETCMPDVKPDHIWIMPEGTDPTTINQHQKLAEEAIDAGYNLSFRIHSLLWGNERQR